MQSRQHSAAEAVMNIAIGYAVSLAAQCVIFPLFGIHTSLGENALIGAAFTVVSLVRGYTLRRLFNRLDTRPADVIQPEIG
jgi:acetyltransferase-like isoleucine patch superfamily enzyme